MEAGVMELDELLALMAAQIYAARLNVYMAEVKSKTEESFRQFRDQAMRISVEEARMIWEIAHATKGKAE